VYDEGDLMLGTWVDDLVAQGRIKVLINLADVTSIDSCGVGILVAKLVSVRQRGGDVKLLNLSQRSHRVMAISRLLEVFDTFDSEAAALASFSARVES
jgi:anti-sigma B factor antagonist